jgi:hypothetical protein
LDWSSFNLHGDAPERAFEALTGILFERWCYREYPSQVQQVVFVNGAGGDGGVEAYAQLINGQLIGLQAKWFRDSIESSQIAQIKKSLATAESVRHGLIRYIVTIPRDLSDAKTNKRATTTERDRWNNFVKNVQQKYPNISINLWGETQITQLLAELGSEGLQRYWFQKSVVDTQLLRLKFEQAQSGWLNPLYAPDFHQTGQIEDDLILRLNGPAIRPEWLHEAEKIHLLLENAHRAVLRLRRYPEFMESADAEVLIQAAEKWFRAAITEQQELLTRITPGNAFPVADFFNELNDATPLLNLIQVLQPEDSRSADEKATESIYKELNHVLEKWYKRKVSPKDLRCFGQPVAYIGEPGVGKTHALANAVGKHLLLAKPAILIRARDVDLTKSWDSILAEGIGETGWNVFQVLDALSSAAIQSTVHIVSQASEVSVLPPVRALIAIDGLDESTRAKGWQEKLGELQPIAKKYPQVLFVCSLRYSLKHRMSIPDNWDTVWLNGSDAPLAEVFKAYCNANRIECAPLLRWALRTPLAIRLFAEIYQGKNINSISLQEFSITELIQKKINYAERSIKESHEGGWPDGLNPVKTSLCAIAKACLSQGQAIPQEQALQTIESAQKTKGVLSRLQLLPILHKCRDSGLLLRKSWPSDNPFEEEIYTWEPAYETLTDFLLAWEAYESAKLSAENPDMPEYLRYRGDAVTLAVYLLAKDGHNFLTSKLWSNNLHDKQRQDLQLIAISMMPSKQALAYRDWVQNLFIKNMPSCREVLRRLVIPGLRIPGFIYGAKFVHDVLLPMQVAVRDIFWSAPHYVPENHNAPWEGMGSDVLENLDIADDDPWDSAPLLLAWATTTVNNKNRRRIRSVLAIWGSSDPDRLLRLLQAACQTNDPQMKEDLLCVAYGASCLTRPSETWLPLCNWIIDNLFVKNAPYRTHDVIVRHCAQSLIERCVVCNVSLDKERLACVREALIDATELLYIDREVAINVNEEHGNELTRMDLAWYVVPKAIKPFFDSSPVKNSNSSRSCTPNDEPSVNYNEIENSILLGFVEGRLRKSVNDEMRQHVTKILDERTKTQEEIATQQEQSNRLLNQLRQQLLGETSDDETIVIPRQTQQLSEYSSSAQSFLAQYAKIYNFSNLTPKKLAFGFVSAYAAQLGWSRDIFIKNPRGGNAGEILGADIAILRQYPQSTHGSRSSMATFAEKYVWAAVNELLGFLADRIPARGWGNYYEPPVNPSFLAEATNPASDVGYGHWSSEEVLDFSELTPDIELSATVQSEMANEWVQHAPLPSIEQLLLPNSIKLPEWARDNEWITLRVFTTKRHVDSQAESTIWAASFVFPSSMSSILEEDTSVAALTKLHEFRSSIYSVEFYQNPNEVVWAPWIKEQENIISHKTLDVEGNPTEINLLAATCQFHWESPEGETEEWIPSQWLLKILNIVDFHAGKFFNPQGEVVAFTYNISGERWLMPHCQVLLARRNAVFQALRHDNLALAWGVRVYREAAYPLNVISGQQRMFRDWCASVFWSNGELKTVSFQDNTEPWEVKDKKI